MVLEGVKSNYTPVLSGVPQGSVLGPTLFLAFINDLSLYVKSKIRLFADDTITYLTVKSVGDCVQLQRDLHNLEIWESDWKMEFNISKCNVLRFTRRRHLCSTITNFMVIISIQLTLLNISAFIYLMIFAGMSM